MVKRILSDVEGWWREHRSLVLDVWTGAMIVLAVTLLLNRDLFGLGSGQGWTVNYGAF